MINKDINIKVLSNSMVILNDKTVLGISGENLQGKIIFNFEEFIDGVAWLEIEKENGEKGYIQMTKENETYTLEIKSSLLNQAGYIYMQLRITQDENVNGIPVFKSKKFYVEVLNAINATATIEDDYPSIIDIVNNKLEADDITAGDNITIEKSGKKVIINSANSGDVSKKYVDDQDTKTLESAKQYADKQVPNVVETYVNEHKEELKGDKGDTGSQGPQGLKGDTGSAGADAKINGKNAIEIEAGNNITIEDTEKGIKINSTGGGSGGSSDYEELDNLPKVNNVTLKGNKSLNDLGIQPAGNYALESEMPTKTSDLTNDSGFITSYTETDPTVPSHVKNITQTNITNWNNKSDFSGNYNDLTNKPTIPTVPTNVSAFTNDVGYLTEHQDISGKANKISVVQTSTSTIEINSNTFYKFGEVTELNLTLAEITDTTQLNEFMFEFISGATATTLTLPSSVKWLETPTIESNKIYQCSIVDNIGILVGVANE